MPDDLVLVGAGTDAVVRWGGEEATLPIFVGRGELREDGVLLHEGRDVAAVRWGARRGELPLYKTRADGSLARVRVAEIHMRDG